MTRITPINIAELVNTICLLQPQDEKIMNVWKRVLIYHVEYIETIGQWQHHWRTDNYANNFQSDLEYYTEISDHIYEGVIIIDIMDHFP